GRRHRPHEAGHERRLRRLLEVAGVEIEHGLARARIEAHALGLHQHAAALEHQAHLGERLPDAGIATAERVERLADLAHRRAGIEQRRRRAERQQLAERVAQLAVQQVQALELCRPPLGEGGDAREVAPRVVASRAESTRFIWPAPTPTTWSTVVRTMALDLACLPTRQAKRSA